MDNILWLVMLMTATLVLGQRPFFAGTKPIGYPELENQPGLGDRYGEVDGTTPKLPIEANGDFGLIDRLSKLPIDKQPFWFINWQAYEAERNNPQTYPQRPSGFIDPIRPTNAINGNASPNPVSPNSNTATSNSDSTANRFGESDSSSSVKPIRPSSSEMPSSLIDPITTSNNGNDRIANSEAVKPNSNSASAPNSSVKPVVLASSGGHKNQEATVKPVATKAPNNEENNHPKSESTTSKFESTSPQSKPGNKLEDLIPLLPSPIEPESTVIDGLKLKKDSNENKKYGYIRNP